MQHTAVLPPRGATELEFNPPFNVVIAYEDFETGKQAKKTYDFLVENLGQECHFLNQMWKFDVLSIPKLREIAFNDAATADIVIVSCHGGELPAHVKSWLEGWVAEGARPLALVALIDRAPQENAQGSAVRAYLAEIAKRGQMEFFAQPDHRLDRLRMEDFSGLRTAGNLKGKTFSTLVGMLEEDLDAPRWGINE